MRKTWPWQWSKAGVLALLLFGPQASAHVAPRRAEAPLRRGADLAHAPPAMIMLLAGYVVLSVIDGVLIAACIWDGRFAPHQAHWAQEEVRRGRLDLPEEKADG